MTEETARREEETRRQREDEMIFLSTTTAFEKVVDLLFVETIGYAGRDSLAQAALANAQAAKIALASILELALEGLLFSGDTTRLTHTLVHALNTLVIPYLNTYTQ